MVGGGGGRERSGEQGAGRRGWLMVHAKNTPTHNTRGRGGGQVWVWVGGWVGGWVGEKGKGWEEGKEWGTGRKSTSTHNTRDPAN